MREMVERIKGKLKDNPDETRMHTRALLDGRILNEEDLGGGRAPNAELGELESAVNVKSYGSLEEGTLAQSNPLAHVRI
jgi:hypothetical protein